MDDILIGKYFAVRNKVFRVERRVVLTGVHKYSIFTGLSVDRLYADSYWCSEIGTDGKMTWRYSSDYIRQNLVQQVRQF